MDQSSTTTIECPRCAEDISADSTNCEHCGSEIKKTSSEVSRIEPSASGLDETENKSCPHCGEQIKAEAIKCRHCQSNLVEAPAKKQAEIDPSFTQSAPTKRCPDCAEEILAAAKKCKHCGSIFGAAPASSAIPGTALQPMQSGGQQLIVRISDKLIRPDTDPMMMTILSLFCFNGLSQIVMGQVGKGIVIFLVNHSLAACTFGVSFVLTWPLCVIDTYRIACKLKKGQEVGKWECF